MNSQASSRFSVTHSPLITAYINKNTTQKEDDTNSETKRLKTGDFQNSNIISMKKKTLKKNMLAFNVNLSHMSDRQLINMNDDCVVKEGVPRERSIDIVSLRQYVKHTKVKTQDIKDEHSLNKTAVRDGLRQLRMDRKDTNDDIKSQMKDALTKLRVKAHVSDSTKQFNPTVLVPEPSSTHGTNTPQGVHKPERTRVDVTAREG